jgi:hypothetical protein
MTGRVRLSSGAIRHPRSAAVLLAVGVLAGLAVGALRAQDPEKDRPGSGLGPAPASPQPPKEEPRPAEPPVSGGPGPLSGPQPVPPPGQQRFEFKIKANTPLKDLLPPAPKVEKPSGPLLSDDLTRVPEVKFQAPTRDASSEEALKRTAHQIAKINHLNKKKTDGFVEALLSERRDLAGLPMAMGDACRTKGERSRQFAAAVALVRQTLQGPVAKATALRETTRARALRDVERAAVEDRELRLKTKADQAVGSAPAAPTNFVAVAGELLRQVPDGDGPTEGFWERYAANCAAADKEMSRTDRELREHVTLARIAALMQILAPEAPSVRLGLVKHLSTISHAEATKALARLAIFSTEGEVREAAVDALKVRRERDYTDVLVQGLRYPWPAVARRAGEAIVKLERNDLVPQLLDVLEAPDPRSPVLQEVGKKQVPMVRELVRVNHHQSCLLCHSPGNDNKVSGDAVTAAVPLPTDPLPTPQEGGYQQNPSPDVLVRVDVTYLRQDFSVYQAVADAAPWPELQRFDFLVRTRELTEEEAAAYKEKLEKREPGTPSPYQRAALAALRDLTGKDAEPTAEAWRKLLKMPARSQ